MSSNKKQTIKSIIQNVFEADAVSYADVDYLLSQVHDLDHESKSILVDRMLDDTGIRTAINERRCVPSSVVAQSTTSHERNSIAVILETLANKLSR